MEARLIQRISSLINRPAHSRGFLRTFLSAGLLLAICLPFAFSPGVTAQQSTPAVDVSGSWTGTLGAGQNQLHLVVTFAKLSNGDYAGQVNSTDQGAVLPISNITVQGQKVRFEITPVGGVYEGTLSDDRNQINGTWTQTNVPSQPVNLKRSEAAAPSSAGSSSAASGPKEKPFTVPIDVSVPIAPTAFKADG